MRVQGPVLAGGFLDVQFSGLRDMQVVGIITCERRGSYSARVPRSSLARVYMVFVLHIVEEEDESQEDEQDDRTEDRQQEVEGRVAESQNNHIMSA